jgi:PAS domain S-box-containing protein
MSEITASRANLSRFSLYVWLTMAMFAVVIACFVVYVRAEKQIDHANELRQRSFMLSEELRGSSDDLTRMVRNYVATSNPVFKQHYREILDIRDGKKPRPVDYQNVYWDLVTQDDQRPRPMGPAVPLLTLMRQAGFTDAELSKLQEAKSRSDALTSIEWAAMAEIELTNPPTLAHRVRATEMLHNTAYLQAKADIMRPISEFKRMADQRTLKAVQDAEGNATAMRWVLVVFAIVPMWLLWRTRCSLNAILGGSVSDVFTSIARLGSGDLVSAIPVKKGMEDSVLGWLLETQGNLARLDAERRRAEDAVRESEKRFHQALDDMMEGCTLIGFDWTLLYINEAAARPAQLHRTDLVGRKMMALHPGIENTEIFAIFGRVMQDRIPQRLEASYRFPDGEVRWFAFSVAPIREGISVLSLDISERRELAMRLQNANVQLEKDVAARTADLQAALDSVRQSSAAKSTFLSGMSHELRTPMNAILGFSQLLQLQALPARQMTMVNEIRQAGEHLLALIDDLLDLSRIESGKVPLTSVPVSVAGVVQEALSIVQTNLTRMSIDLVNQVQGDACVLADPVRLRQVIVNLMSNAAKYNRKHGQVWINAVVSAGQRVRLSVRDTGHGIAPEQMPSLFRTFERLGAEHSGIEGNGIGLALSKQLAELMGGSIGVESRVGEGSTFWIELPVAEPGRADSAVTVSTAGVTVELEPFDVLYIEDNEANLMVVEHLFGLRPHWHLMTATTGQAGLALARTTSLDAILLDIHLPGMDGYEVMRALQADSHTRSVPVIALSADAMQAHVERGRQAGFRAYLSKPLNLLRLLSTLDELAASSRASTQLSDRRQMPPPSA